MKRTLLSFVVLFVFLLSAQAQPTPNAWINEFHYDNAGGDSNEFVEIVIRDAGSYTLSDFSVVLYRDNGTSYTTETIDNFAIGTTSNGFTIYTWQPSSIQNGPGDGLALCHTSGVIQVLSYEGTFTATEECASGETSVDIGVQESGSTLETESLQLVGSGMSYTDFAWTGPTTASVGSVNASQTLQNLPVTNLTQGTSYATIQEALDAAADGDVIEVAEGTFEEQLVIEHDDLTIYGAGSSSDPAANTVIRSPESLGYSFAAGSDENYPIVGIHDATGVTLKDVRIDGAGRGNGNYRFVGVGFWNAGGAIENSAITGVRETPFSGSQHGIAIYANNDTGGPYTVAVQSTAIDDFQKNGMALSGMGLTVDINGNAVIGAGTTSVNGQNGIQMGYGATGSITQNTVSGVAYDGSEYAAAGILVLYAEGTMVVQNNTVEEAQVGLWFYNNAAEVTGNEVTAPATVGVGSWGAILDPVKADPTPTPTPFESDNREAKTAKASSAISYVFDDNALVGTDVEGSTGLEIYSGSETVEVVGTGNLIKDFETGVFVGEAEEGLIASVALNENCIVSNETIGLVNNAALIVDAAGNWWGSAAGPGTGGANGVDGPVTIDPVAPDPVSGVEGCGGASGSCPAADFTETVLSNTPPGEVQITIHDTEGIEQIRFYEVVNFTIASDAGDFTNQGEGIWTPTATGDTETSFTLTQADTDDPDASYFAQITNDCGTVTDIDPVHALATDPETFALEGNYPNPFRMQTTLQFALPETADVTLSVYDVMGRKAATLVEDTLPAGTHDVVWQGRTGDGRALASGIYFVRLEAGSRVQTQRVTLVK